ncbi:MAG: MotA/TolQ/ExbB proton channel family protein [Clostridiales bacterium]|nr:MotA/TolQ/ExbB proton channel family protein [Clostridiales bacterium]
MSEIIKDILRAVASSLQIPTIIILLLLILATIVLLGTFIAELFTERKALKVNIPALIDDMQGKNTTELDAVVSGSGLLKRQKDAAHELIVRIKYPNDTREALARQIISDEESRYSKITKFTDIIARVAPMFGLMGTLIPLGPGLIALAQGDTKTLSESLLIAFDTTVAGLISAAVAYVISGIRKGWYETYMVGLETIMETILEEQNRERLKAYRALQKKQTAKEDSE